MLDSTLANVIVKLFILMGQVVASWGEHYTLVQAIKYYLITRKMLKNTQVNMRNFNLKKWCILLF
jgi:hypothetical protein